MSDQVEKQNLTEQSKIGQEIEIMNACVRGICDAPESKHISNGLYFQWDRIRPYLEQLTR